MSQDLQLSASCAFGLESVVARELKALGMADIRQDNGSVSFAGGADAICRANMWLRCADRVWIRVGQFPAATFEDLFQGVKALPWPDLLPRNASFPVDGASHESTLSSVPACQGVVKKAIVESMKGAYRVEWFAEDGPVYRVRTTLVRDTCTVAIDTSGSGLHRRGYRTLNAAAPLRETLAAGLVLLSVWNADRILADPFCGSGTIPIEAALIGLKRAPGLRRAFASESWPFVGRRRWEAVRDEAEQVYDRTTKLSIQGSDIDPEVLKLARHHLRAADLEDRGIHFQVRDALEFRSQKKYGVMIANPPYGERLSEQREVEALYRDLGKALAPLDTWSVYVLTTHPRFERLFAQSVVRKRKLYNGMLQCVYYQFVGPRPPRRDDPTGAASFTTS